MGRRNDFFTAVYDQLKLIATPAFNLDIVEVYRRMVAVQTLADQTPTQVPGLMMGFGRDWSRVRHPDGVYTRNDEVEETLPIIIRGVVTGATGDVVVSQVDKLVADIDSAIGDTVALSIEGGKEGRITEIDTLEGWWSPLEVLDFRFEIVHTFGRNESV